MRKQEYDPGVGRKTVRKWLVDAGVEIRRRGPMSSCNASDEVVRGLWDDRGLTLVEIGRRLGVSVGVVSRRARWWEQEKSGGEVEGSEEVVDDGPVIRYVDSDDEVERSEEW